MGPLVLGLLWLLMHKTRFGVLVRAATQDREMVGALGVNQALLFTGTLFLGAALAGLGGALQTPKLAANPHMDISVIAEAFVVTVVGGMGSVPGAFLAALLIGQLQAFGILVFPKITLVLVFLMMALVLVVRPWGLMGRPDAGQARVVLPEGIVRLARFGRPEHIMVAVAAVVLLALPLIGDAYLIKVAIEVLCFALAAFSLNFLIGVGGIVSFGHAAYFGLGAYAAGLLVTRLGFSMEPALLAAPVIAGLGAALFGFFIVRLTGIYLAMLTLAFAQIVYAVAFQWVEVTGGDNGVVGVWPSRWAAGRVTYYYLTLAVTAAAIVVLRQGSLRALRLHAARGAQFGRTRRRHRHRRAHASVAGFHRCRRRSRAGRRLVRVLQGLDRPDADLHPHVGRFPGHDPARRRADGDRAAGRRGGVPFHPRLRHAAHRLLAPAAGACHHRHRAGLPARHRRRRHGPAIPLRPTGHAAIEGPGMSLLEVEGLSKSFGGVVAASNVTFAVEAGRLLAVIGPNGAGKTTIFNMLGGQLAPDSGRVALAGQSITGLAPRRIWRLGVGRTFQIAQTFVSMTVAENVQMALISLNGRTRAWWPDAGGLYRDEAVALLERVGLGADADRPCSELAYGDVKRVELAIALAGAPKLLLMDEPTAGMAPKERAQLMQLTVGIARERGLGVLFTEHDMDTVFAHADDIIVLVHGEIIAAGRPEDVRANARVREVYLGGSAGAGAQSAPGCGVRPADARWRHPRSRRPRRRLWPGADPVRCVAAGGARRDRRPDGAQWRRQIDHAQGHHRTGAGTRPELALCRPGYRWHGELSHRPAGARLRAGGPARLHRPHRRREPGGRHQGGGRRTTASRGLPSACSRSFPTSRRCATAAPARCRAASSRCSPSPAR